jgi:competence protein ComEC
LLLYDPLLAWSLAFQLSVAATAGLIIATPRIGDALPGPSWVRLTAAATIGAQLFVSPLLLATFGQVSLVAVPANLLATPAAAGVMMWGLVAGTIAGLVPEAVAAAVHLPTRLMLWWIDGVASISARIPIGRVGILHLVVIASCGGLLMALPRRLRGSWRAGRSAATIGLTIALLLPVLAPKALGPGTHTLPSGVVVVRSAQGHDVLIVNGSLRSSEVIESIRTARVGRIDLMISTDGSRSAGGLVRLVTDRFEVSEIWAPPGHQIPGARVMPQFVGVVGTLRIEPEPDGDVAVVELAT